jgi:hypothetical protein
VTASATASMTFVDSVDGLTANLPIGVVPANLAVGAVYNFQVPASRGMW